MEWMHAKSIGGSLERRGELFCRGWLDADLLGGIHAGQGGDAEVQKGRRDHQEPDHQKTDD